MNRRPVEGNTHREIYHHMKIIGEADTTITSIESRSDGRYAVGTTTQKDGTTQPFAKRFYESCPVIPDALLKDHTFHINIEHDGIFSWWCECPDWYLRNIPVEGSETFVYLHATKIDPDRVNIERPGTYIVGDPFGKRIYPKTVIWNRQI